MSRKLKRDIKIAKDRIGGAEKSELSVKYGLTPQRINQILKQESIQDFIDEVTKAITLKEGVEAYKNISYAIQNYRNEKADPQLRSHGYDASKELLRSIGVLESRNVSISVQNITNTQNNIVSPMMQELIQKHLGLKQPEVIELEPCKDCKEQ